MENDGLDSASAKRFDTIGRELADNHPGIFGGQGYGDEGKTDYGSVLWDLIREGAKKVPGRASKEFHEHIDAFLRSQLKGSRAGDGNLADDDLAMTPFSKEGRELLHLLYAKWDRRKHPRDERGRFVVVVSGEEFGKGLDGPALRKAAFVYAMKNFSKKSYHNRDSGREIKVSRTGIKKTCTHLPDKNPILLLAKLPSLLMSSVMIGSAEPSGEAANVKAFHYLEADVEVAGIPMRTIIKIREDTNGNWYYDQHVLPK